MLSCSVLESLAIPCLGKEARVSYFYVIFPFVGLFCLPKYLCGVVDGLKNAWHVLLV